MSEEDEMELVLIITGLLIASVVGVLLGMILCEGIYQVLCW